MISTFSKFYYGYEVTADNNLLDFSEGGSGLTAEIDVGSYTPTDFCTAVKIALDTAGALTYTVSFNRTNRKITISAGSNFTLKKSTGSHIGTSPWSLMGFTGSDSTGASTYTGAAASGSSYSPQFKLQDYVPSTNLQQAVDATVNKTATGKVEVIKFGTESFVEMNVMFATDITQDGSVIKTNPTGVSDLRTFLQFLVTKAPCEFMPDDSVTGTFETLMLESTVESSTGVGYRLQEMYDKGIPGYFQTGRLKFRVIE